MPRRKSHGFRPRVSGEIGLGYFLADGPRIVVDAGTGVALTIAATAIVLLGVVPGIMLDFAHAATQLLAH